MRLLCDKVVAPACVASQAGAIRSAKVEQRIMSKKADRISRRDALAGLIVLPALAALVPKNATAGDKETKQQLGYQATPHGTQRCANCIVFHPGKTPASMGTCDLVQGAISPNGWCRVFHAKAAQ
jgi:hypothetical protein